MPIENAITLLEAICPEVYQQGSMAPNAKYPDRFFTFWNGDTHDSKHYDNAASGYVWALDVNFYSTKARDVYDTLDAARAALLAAGWTISGKGHTVASDYNTHKGRGFTAYFLESEN